MLRFSTFAINKRAEITYISSQAKDHRVVHHSSAPEILLSYKSDRMNKTTKGLDEIENFLIDFFSQYFSLDGAYETFQKSCTTNVSKNQFLEFFNNWKINSYLTQTERNRIEEMFKHKTFEDITENNLKGIKYPSQEKEEILFELITDISSIINSSPGNHYHLEILKHRWDIAQKEEGKEL